MKKLFFGFFFLLLSGFFISLLIGKNDELKKSVDYSILKYKFTPGEERIFDLSQSTEISFHNQGTNSSISNFKMKGSLIERVYEVKDDFVLIGVKIEDPSINLNESKNLDLLRKALGKEVFVKITPQRKILNFFFPKGQSSEAANILKSVTAATQVILPEIIKHKNEVNYQLTELNMNGPVQVEYNILFQKNISIEKSFLKYDFIGFNDMSESEIIFLPVSKSFSIFDKGYLTKIDHRESTLMDSSGLQVNSTVKTEISFKEKNTFQISGIKLPWNNSQYFISKIFGEEIGPEERKSNLKKQIGDIKIENLFENINKLNFKTQGKEAYEIFRKIKTYLELYPEQIQKVMEQIDYLDPQDPYYENILSLYFGALSTMEARYAQEPLMDIVLKNQDSSIQIQAFGALADLGLPTKKTQEFLIDYYKNPFTPESQSLAALSLGTLAYMAKNNSPALVKETSDFLKEQLIHAHKKEDILTLISAIGNSGNANLLENLMPFMESKEKDISTSAVLALENMAGERVNQIIKDMLTNHLLKGSALYVLSKSPSSKSQLGLAISFFEKESDPELKTQSLKIISNNSRFFRKEVSKYLENVKSKDPNPKIRNAALDLLITL
ncbi:MAG: hypothetical protein ACHQYQ_02515 [Bacteriovoracales bacterium]